MKKILLLLFILLIGCAKPDPAQNTTTTIVEKPVDNFFYVAGVIQLDPNNNWELLNDGGHTSMNVDHIEVNTYNITVYYTQTVKTIYTAGIFMDETFSGEGYWAGPSIGLSYMVIEFGQLISGSVQPITTDQLKIGQGNFQFLAVMEK